MNKFWDWIYDDSGGRVLRLEGPIDSELFWGDEVTPDAFRDDLYAEEGDITLWLNSPGGNVFAAAEIYTMIKDYPGKVTVKIASVAASAASVIAMAGSKVCMSPTALLMIHDPSTIAMGDERTMQKAIDTLGEVKESIINAYAQKTGLRRSKIADLMSEETWMNAKKAVNLGFADEVLFSDEKTGGEEPAGLEALSDMVFASRVTDTAVLNLLGAEEMPKEADIQAVEDIIQPEVIAKGPVIGLDGKTEDGDVPYQILMDKLDMLL